MLAPNFSADDFYNAFQALLPRGRAWPKDADSTLGKVISGLSEIYARNNAAAIDLLADAFPENTVSLLPEWESSLGLPDSYLGQLSTIRERQALVLSRFLGEGGQSVPYIISYAANLGWPITITEYAPARAGQSRAGQPLCGEAWAHTWRVNALTITVMEARAGSSVAGEPLVVWGNDQLRYELERISPAHTIINFLFS